MSDILINFNTETNSVLKKLNNGKLIRTSYDKGTATCAVVPINASKIHVVEYNTYTQIIFNAGDNTHQLNITTNNASALKHLFVATLPISLQPWLERATPHANAFIAR